MTTAPIPCGAGLDATGVTLWDATNDFFVHFQAVIKYRYVLAMLLKQVLSLAVVRSSTAVLVCMCACPHKKTTY